jgi:hypothetical protein
MIVLALVVVVFALTLGFTSMARKVRQHAKTISLLEQRVSNFEQVFVAPTTKVVDTSKMFL